MRGQAVNEAVVAASVRRCRERGIVIPTLSEQIDPGKIPPSLRNRLEGISPSDLHPLNLFRITWKNDVTTGLYAGVNFVEIPREITGLDARIIGLVGEYFPTGSHKVGAAFGCLVPRLLTGQFDPDTQTAVWPSTGNYCRGGAFDCALLGCRSLAILPEEMSRERFEWLAAIGAEVIATPGCESNVKEIYDACRSIRQNRSDCVIFNQFEETGNCAWHYHVTGSALREAFEAASGPRSRLAAFVSATGSAGTIGAADYLKKMYPQVRVAATEALQCPTLLRNGYGGHRIEGIGDKHVPWIHNVRSTDVVMALDDDNPVRVLRLFNERAGHAVLARNGVSPEDLARLPLLGISSIANLLCAMKMAKYFEFGRDDVVLTVFTDSARMYGSRLDELTRRQGAYAEIDAVIDLERYLRGIGTDNMRELGYQDRKALHNLKYFTWVEQQGKPVEELNALWDPEFWEQAFGEVADWDELIAGFNDRCGILAAHP